MHIHVVNNVHVIIHRSFPILYHRVTWGCQNMKCGRINVHIPSIRNQINYEIQYECFKMLIIFFYLINLINLIILNNKQYVLFINNRCTFTTRTPVEGVYVVPITTPTCRPLTGGTGRTSESGSSSCTDTKQSHYP